MGICFEIYLPLEADWSKFPFQVPMFAWHGVQYPQGEPECTFGPNWKLKKLPPNQPYRFMSLPLSHRTPVWQPVFIGGPGLSVCQSSLNGYEIENEKYSLEKLLHWLLADQPKWVLVWIPGYDDIHEVIPGDINTVLEKVRSSLTVESRGYVIWGGFSYL